MKHEQPALPFEQRFAAADHSIVVPDYVDLDSDLDLIADGELRVNPDAADSLDVHEVDHLVYTTGNIDVTHDAHANDVDTDDIDTDDIDDDADNRGANANDASDDDAPVRTPLTYVITRSRKRKKSVSARMVEGVVHVTVPSWMTAAESQRYAEELCAKFENKRGRNDGDLLRRARRLCRAHDLPLPLSVRWVTNQRGRWGSCTPDEGTIRLSHRLREAPPWVVDYVLVHELAHLRHPDHSPEFWKTVSAYPMTERARGFLDGWSHADSLATP
jgi:predicted metal-dependent hydrolase